MTTNGEWLDYLAHNAPDELAAWFDAEHVETANAALDGDTAALNAKLCVVAAEREIYREALSELLNKITEGMGKVSALLDNYDEGMA